MLKKLASSFFVNDKAISYFASSTCLSEIQEYNASSKEIEERFLIVSNQFKIPQNTLLGFPPTFVTLYTFLPFDGFVK